MLPMRSATVAIGYLLLIVCTTAESELDDKCKSPHGEEGMCRLLSNCPPLFALLNGAPKPLPADVVNTLMSYSCGFVRYEPVVCCTSITQTTNNYVNDLTSTTTPVNTILNRDTENSVPLPEHPNVHLLPFDICGISTEQKISNGNKTSLFEFPWMALLQYKSDKGLRFLCGGSLISDRYVLTAAHCVTKLKGNTLVAVRLGEHDVTTDIDCESVDNETICADPVQDIEVEEILWHPRHHKYYDDVALIRLRRPANMTSESVRPICLPVYNSTLPHYRFSVSGWGLTEQNVQSRELLQASVPIVPNDICQKQFGRVTIRPTQLCAGGEIGIDSCKGDSGGPLVSAGHLKKNNVRFIQYGVVSLGRDGCSSDNKFPGVYTRVGLYLKWILDNIRQ